MCVRVCVCVLVCFIKIRTCLLFFCHERVRLCARLCREIKPFHPPLAGELPAKQQTKRPTTTEHFCCALCAVCCMSQESKQQPLVYCVPRCVGKSDPSTRRWQADCLLNNKPRNQPPQSTFVVCCVLHVARVQTTTLCVCEILLYTQRPCLWLSHGRRSRNPKHQHYLCADPACMWLIQAARVPPAVWSHTA